jgi:hypothetical protein
VLRHRVPHFTLCPLVSPEIAIGLEPRIEPWWTLTTPGLACQVSRLDWRRHQRQMNPTEMANKPEQTSPANRGHTYSSGLDLETKIFSASGRGRSFFLTSLFIELIKGECSRLFTALTWVQLELQHSRWCATREQGGLRLKHGRSITCHALRFPNAVWTFVTCEPP